jgi:endo-beta-N-acetylglucosaminidase D
MLIQERGSLAPVIFKTASDVLGWQPSSVNPLMVSSVPVAKRIAQPQLRFLAGLDNGQWSYWPEFDRSPQGGPRGNVYNFPFWQYVDDMYYYMHNLAAVPPVVWTNAAHRNGVRMFAAVTADFDPTPCVGGREFDKLFVDPPKAADQLFKIVNAYRFDGWMFDVENCATASPNLLATMKLLRAMRLWNGAQVEVGYYEGGGYAIDAPTLPFFQAGSFFQSDYSSASDPTNYPEQTYQLLLQKGFADQRFNTYWSVYTNNYSQTASGPGYLYNGCAWLDVKGFFDRIGMVRMNPPASSFYQSIGIYAPDWTMYGGVSENKQCQLPKRDVFQRTERLLWVGKAIGENGQPVTSSPCVADFITPRSVISTPPFLTRFNTGQGSFYNVSGKRVANKEWNYLSGQDLLPTWMSQLAPGDPGIVADYTYDDAYDGGSGLAFKGVLAAGNTVEYQLYLTQIALTNAAQAVFRYKRGASALLPYLRIVYSNNTSEVVSAGAVPDWQRVTQTLSPPPNGVIVELRVGFRNSSPNAAPVDIVMGELGVLWAGGVPPANIIDVTATPDKLLIWQQPGGLFTPGYYNVYAPTASGPAFMGRTILTSYDLTAPLFPIEGINGNVYKIQPVSSTGQASPI